MNSSQDAKNTSSTRICCSLRPCFGWSDECVTMERSGSSSKTIIPAVRVEKRIGTLVVSSSLLLKLF